MLSTDLQESTSIQLKCNNFNHLPAREAWLKLMECHLINHSVNERWVGIPGFSNYLISSGGRIKNLYSYAFKPRILVPTIRDNRYFYITIKNDLQTRVGIAVDRLMITSFFKVPLDQVRKVTHLDGRHFNNKLENLNYSIW